MGRLYTATDSGSEITSLVVVGLRSVDCGAEKHCRAMLNQSVGQLALILRVMKEKKSFEVPMQYARADEKTVCFIRFSLDNFFQPSPHLQVQHFPVHRTWTAI